MNSAAATSPKPRPAMKARLLCLLPFLLLHLISMFAKMEMPEVLDGDDGRTGYDVYYGAMLCLVIGIPAWLANPLAYLALLLSTYGFLRSAILLAIPAVLIALWCLIFVRMDGEGSVFSRSPAYFYWLGSIVWALVTPILLLTLVKRGSAPEPVAA